MEEAWPKLFEKFAEAMKQGLSPSDPKVQLLAKEAQGYIDLFTGGDQDIEATLNQAYEKNQLSAQQRWGIEEKVFAYATQARTHYRKG